MLHRLQMLRRPSVQASAVMLAATTLASLLNYVFNLVTGRLLGPEEYSVMSALLGVYVVVSIPAAVLNTIAAKRVSEHLALGSTDAIGGAVHRMGRTVLWYGGGAVSILLLLSPCVARFLQIDNPWPVVAMLSIVLPALALYVARGCLQGAQRFGALAANSVLESVVRLVGGIALVALGWGASGGLLALTLGSAGALILALASLRPLLQERAPRLADKDGQPAFFVLAFAGFLAFATLTNVDTALVRHYFAPQPAGEYAAVATLGRTVLFFPTSIATVMFPKTAGQHIRGLATYATLGKSVAATVTLCLIPVTGMILWARPLLLWSYGEAYVGGAGLLGFYGITMGIYALMSLLLQYFLSVNDGRFVVALLAVAASSLAGIGLFHASMTQVVGVMATVGGLAVTVGVFLCAFPVNRGHRA